MQINHNPKGNRCCVCVHVQSMHNISMPLIKQQWILHIFDMVFIIIINNSLIGSK